VVVLHVGGEERADARERDRWGRVSGGHRLIRLGRRSDVSTLLAAADLVAMPSEHEGFPLAAAESFCAGTPVLAADTPGLGWVTGFRTGRALQRSSIAWAAELERAAERRGTPEWQTACHQDAEDARRRFSPERGVAEWCRIYEQSMPRGSAGLSHCRAAKDSVQDSEVTASAEGCVISQQPGEAATAFHKSRSVRDANAPTVHSLLAGEFPDDVRVYNQPHLPWRKAAAAFARGVRPGDALVINGAVAARRLYVNQLLVCAFRLLRPNVTVIVADATWAARARPGEQHAPWLAWLIDWSGKLSVRAMRGPRTHFCFLARTECDLAVREAGIPASHVHFTPFHTTISPDQFDMDTLQAVAAEPDDYIFSGGSASRDYTLLRAAAGTDIPLKVATSIYVGPWPTNAEVRCVSHEEFVHWMARSRAVVLPLATDTTRSGGQQTYLNAMLLGKPVVVTDAPGARDYITHGENGYIVAPKTTELRKAMQYILDPRNGAAVARVASKGRELAEFLTPSAYFRTLTDVARKAMSMQPSGRKYRS
jgi:glycosyltransferase involved in cell wall biosynthesis